MSDNPFISRFADEPATTGTDVVVTDAASAQLDHPITGGEMAVLYRLGRGLAASGMFKDARQADQAFAKLIFGRDLGLSATQAMTDIHIIEGKPEMSANLQASKVRGADRYEYDVLDLTNERCELQFWKDGEEVGKSEFTIEDAKTAGLVKDKSPWVKYPRNMLFARAMSNGVAWYCPDVMNGIRVYAEGELADVQRVESSGAPVAAPADAEPPDAEVVEDDPLLTEQERFELDAAFEEAGASLGLFLTAVGVAESSELRQSHKLALSQKLAQHLTNGAHS